MSSKFSVTCYNPFPCLKQLLYEDDPLLQPFELLHDFSEMFYSVVVLTMLISMAAGYILLLVWAANLSTESITPPKWHVEEENNDLDRFNFDTLVEGATLFSKSYQ
jgi:hypothetical protein